MRLKPPVNILYLITAIFVFSLKPSFAQEKTPFLGEVNANQINLRSDATTSAAIICTLNKGERVDVVLELYDWYKVRLPKKAPAYIKNKLASCIRYANDPTTGQTTQACLSAKVLGDRVNIRAKPDEASPILGLADKNEIINIVDEKKGWYKIEPVQNSFGWIHKKFIVRATQPLAQPAVNQLPQEKRESVENAESNILLIGIVKPYGIVFRRTATHKLETTDNKIFLLKGNRASLNALNYQKVKVIGKIVNQPKAKYPIVEVKIIEVIN